MCNYKKSVRLTIVFFIMIAVLGALTLWSVKLAHAQEEKKVATMVMWFTVDGQPQNIFILDAAHLNIPEYGVVVIDRDEGDNIQDQVLMGGLFDLQNFGYYQVFDINGKLKEKFNQFALQFKAKAGEHLNFDKSTNQQP